MPTDVNVAWPGVTRASGRGGMISSPGRAFHLRHRWHPPTTFVTVVSPFRIQNFCLTEAKTWFVPTWPSVKWWCLKIKPLTGWLPGRIGGCLAAALMAALCRRPPTHTMPSINTGLSFRRGLTYPMSVSLRPELFICQTFASAWLACGGCCTWEWQAPLRMASSFENGSRCTTLMISLVAQSKSPIVRWLSAAMVVCRPTLDWRYCLKRSSHTRTSNDGADHPSCHSRGLCAPQLFSSSALYGPWVALTAVRAVLAKTSDLATEILDPPTTAATSPSRMSSNRVTHDLPGWNLNSRGAIGMV